MARYALIDYTQNIFSDQGVDRIDVSLILENSGGNRDERRYIISADTRNPDLEVMYQLLEYGLSEAKRLRDIIEISPERGAPYVRFKFYTENSNRRELFRWTAVRIE